ncbi:hypothetical protein B0H14DRAFT_2593801 [Mycena olivaceomarginata]|nr:hypothetical protein B0H14DRAFT_2593801 [Mycena olivaceomarginata]
MSPSKLLVWESSGSSSESEEIEIFELEEDDEALGQEAEEEGLVEEPGLFAPDDTIEGESSGRQEAKKKYTMLNGSFVDGNHSCTLKKSLESVQRAGNRELAQKPHAEIRLEVTEKPSQWRGSWVDRQVLDVKSARNLSGAAVMAGKTASPART